MAMSLIPGERPAAEMITAMEAVKGFCGKDRR